MKINGKAWKPQKLPNDKSGESIDWEDRLKHPTDWLISEKLEGIRIEIIEGQAFSREMLLSPNRYVQDMADMVGSKKVGGIIEAELYAPGMNFSEISHFYKNQDVTSDKSKKKFADLWAKTAGGTKTYTAIEKGVKVEKAWPYPGRTPEWLTRWHPEIQFYMFDHIDYGENRTKEERYKDMLEMWMGHVLYTPATQLIAQVVPTEMSQIFTMYDSVVDLGGEGLVAMKRNSLYKPGRLTLDESNGFKIKDNNVEFYGTIVSVEEGTVARDGSDKTVNYFGNSKTSQRQEDRIPSGMAKGFMVKWEGDGREFLVPIAGFDHPDRIQLLQNPGPWIGKRIKFVGMNPVKIGGLPRSVHYTKE